MRCVILQPSYIPWRGYFDLIRRADVFVFFDDVQYDARGWRNRNLIKTPHGLKWLTIPVLHHGSQTEHLAINTIRIDESSDWRRQHLSLLHHSYARAPFYRSCREWLVALYAEPYSLLSDFTVRTTMEIASMLGIDRTRFLKSSDLDVSGRRTDRLVEICKAVGASEYLSGPSAKVYMEPEKFSDAGITLRYIDYEYPEYAQLHPPYNGRVSILDLLFMQGFAAPVNIWG